MVRRQGIKVRGQSIPEARLTRFGLWLIVRHLGLPLLAVLALADLILWAIFRFALASCYGVLCLIG